MRLLRQFIDIGLPLLGVAIILGSVLFVRETLTTQIACVGFGMVLIELGVWKAAHRLLPNERKYHALRAEGDRFIGLVRKLNQTALAVQEQDSTENQEAFADVQAQMRQAIERMTGVAGKTDAQLAAERGETPSDAQQPAQEPAQVS